MGHIICKSCSYSLPCVVPSLCVIAKGCCGPCADSCHHMQAQRRHEEGAAAAASSVVSSLGAIGSVSSVDSIASLVTTSSGAMQAPAPLWQVQPCAVW